MGFANQLKQSSVDLVIVLVIVVGSWSTTHAIGDSVVATKFLTNVSTTLKDFDFTAAGDWGCKAMTLRTVSNIQNKNPDLVLALGDFSYDNNTGCWFKAMSPIIDKTKIVIGEHDYNSDNSSRLQDYVDKFNLTNPYYSFNLGIVHFLAMSSIIPFNNESVQYRLLRDESGQHQFVSDDLYAASQNKSINWIVVYLYTPMYTSPTQHLARENLRDIYHPLFDMYGVDLVLEGHNHNYQRSFPLRYNVTNSSIPIIVDKNVDTYVNPNGTIFAIVGTAGAHQYNLTGQAPYMASQFERFGYLNVKIIQNGTRMVGTFYDNRQQTPKDQFTIIKK